MKMRMKMKEEEEVCISLASYSGRGRISSDLQLPMPTGCSPAQKTARLLHPHHPHPHHPPIEKYVFHAEDGERLAAGANAMLMVMVMVIAGTLKTSQPRATLRRGRRTIFFFFPPTIKSFPTDRRQKNTADQGGERNHRLFCCCF